MIRSSLIGFRLLQVAAVFESNKFVVSRSEGSEVDIKQGVHVQSLIQAKYTSAGISERNLKKNNLLALIMIY